VNVDKVQDLLTKIQNLFSAPALAALRNVLTALAVFVGGLGIAGLTQANLQHLVDLIMSLGTAIALLVTAVAGVVATAMPVIAWFKSTFAAQRKAVSLQPHTVVVQTSTPDAMVKVANELAAMPEVQQVVASPRVAEITPSDKVVVAADSKPVS
jgi:hypothetical protein